MQKTEGGSWLQPVAQPLSFSENLLKESLHALYQWSFGLKSLASEAGKLGLHPTFWGSGWVSNLSGKGVCLDPRKGRYQNYGRKSWEDDKAMQTGLRWCGSPMTGVCIRGPPCILSLDSRSDPVVQSPELIDGSQVRAHEIYPDCSWRGILNWQKWKSIPLVDLNA